MSPNITTPKTAVFAFQFAGWEYQPPAGDQTCLGYLSYIRIEDEELIEAIGLRYLAAAALEGVSTI